MGAGNCQGKERKGANDHRDGRGPVRRRRDRAAEGRARAQYRRRRGPRLAARATPMASTSPTRTCCMIAEAWRDEAAIDAHMNRRTWPELMAPLADAEIKSISIKAYEAQLPAERDGRAEPPRQRIGEDDQGRGAVGEQLAARPSAGRPRRWRSGGRGSAPAPRSAPARRRARSGG